MSMSYHDRDSFTLTTTTYNVSNSARIGVVEAVQIDIRRKEATPGTGNSNFFELTTTTITSTVSPSVHCEKLHITRTTTIHFINT